MNYRVALCVLILPLCFVPRTHAQPTDTSVEAAARRFIVAFNNLDMPVFLDRFADDATIIHPPSGPPRTFPKRVQGKQEIQRTFQVVFDLIRGGRTTPPYQDLQPRDLLIQEYDGVAVVSFHLGNDTRVSRRTLVFRRVGSDWKIVHLHASTFDLPISSAQPTDPIVGTWKLNLAKSKYPIPAPKSMTLTVAPAARGWSMSIDAVGPDGQPQKWGYTSVFDGSESPVTGNPGIDTVVARSTNTGSIVEYRKNGRVVTTTSSVISDDGKMITATVKIPDGQGKELTIVSVYDRQ